MQEEVENRTFNLAITATKLTAKVVIKAALKGAAILKSCTIDKKPVGKQSLKKLIRQDQGVTNIDIAKTDLKGFEKYARKYGVDYAITKDNSGIRPKYLVFFKAKDADAMTAAFNAYSSDVLKHTERPSVLKALHKLMDAVKTRPAKAAVKEKQRMETR